MKQKILTTNENSLLAQTIEHQLKISTINYKKVRKNNLTYFYVENPYDVWSINVILNSKLKWSYSLTLFQIWNRMKLIIKKNEEKIIIKYKPENILNKLSETIKKLFKTFKSNKWEQI